jgi:hypothetical protein
VNGNSTVIRSSKVILNYSEEISNNFIRWSGSINKEKVIMSDSFVFKMLFIVFFFVKSNYPSDINIVEDITVFVWMLPVLMSGVSSFNRSHKSDKFSWNNPVQVTVFNSLVVLVFFNIESFEVVPVELDCVF